MPRSQTKTRITRLTGRSGLRAQINANGSIRRIDYGDFVVNLFVGNELEGGPANLYLRRHDPTVQCTALLGPRSPTSFAGVARGNTLIGTGTWEQLHYSVRLVLSHDAPAWFWHVELHNTGDAPQEVDLIYAQDLALAPYGAVRLNEYYVSQYVDHTPLAHDERGCVVASRQNLAAGGRHPWCLIGSLREGKAFATDAMQLHGLASRAGEMPAALMSRSGLPGRRLQHEHSMVAIQDAPLRLQPGARVALGFFGWLASDHPDATSTDDLACVERALALAEATPATAARKTRAPRNAAASQAASLFSTAPPLDSLELDDSEVSKLFGATLRHEERDEGGRLLSFFHGADRHVVLRAKELVVKRPHGHLLRTGRHAVPDESALTSTPWMAGVFHSMLTQGHVSINRMLSTVHSYLGLFRSHGQRVFVELDGAWKLLDVPSAFEMAPEACRWIYSHAGGVIEVRSSAHSDPHELSLALDVVSGEPLRCLISHHVALNGDDGSAPGPARWWREDNAVVIAPAASSELGKRFAQGSFHILPAPGTAFERVGADELLYLDGQSREQPYLCLVTAPARSIGLRLRGRLVSDGPDVPGPDAPQAASTPLRLTPPGASALADAVARLADIVPWYTHNAFVHYLAPRGLEQYSGGGWGTRDVCQGPLEMLFAFGHTAPVRDLLVRVMRAQDPGGDWPQWFMFFERERAIRAGDSHGDIVFWPLLALALYLIASGDATLLDERVPFFHRRASRRAVQPTVWQHVKRALVLIDRRVVAGTALAAYGHGDWNDALQPADPSMRDHMCSAWTVTLHHQVLVTLAHALRLVGKHKDAARLDAQAATVRSDFQRLLLVDGVLAGYALFEGNDRSEQRISYLLHPLDATTGVRYSVLAMIHAILEDMLSPAQVKAHLALIETHLSGPDGVRLFDRPMAYHGGPQRHFQRAESATFFGREIGLMYMHAHLRYAQALAHVGDANGFFRALCQANPIGIRAVVPTANLRQANCYYSSSDAAFDDRYQASAEYERVARGQIELDGGWRVYSSGAGIALSLIVRRFLGLSRESQVLSIDPVMPASLDGLRVETTLQGHRVEVVYRVQDPGHGVQAVQLNGKVVAFARETNPYRLGAARVPWDVLLESLTAGNNVLTIGVG